MQIKEFLTQGLSRDASAATDEPGVMAMMAQLDRQVAAMAGGQGWAGTALRSKLQVIGRGNLITKERVDEAMVLARHDAINHADV
mmetsp:Transcript_5365/g.9263  ORF Transcript_5365/g.9263 Transcript_5365/m.9263 type:complete len:85 (+) Transcript_5365:425-679(+)|eukprot:CAMPEP_0119106870 /NCGR_PEP_ID=MMETSP1180-20130426/6655_1 /TAXON_ID=3052 ORGANISM="Chlamydomonas cf sp, Strain CCMP681" /NCGR_SAMPLE_ID=MMETSP1180 /ASSEMBLY_ACC=CAM_ASM_000741 /LENGTH=84 /DNA_ID=CAMNT_0007092269 /DNA_START=35 /DNA_END=289 /DNA_ORIENTATION=-